MPLTFSYESEGNFATELFVSNGQWAHAFLGNWRKVSATFMYLACIY